MSSHTLTPHAARCERSYRRTGHKFQVRTSAGRLIATGDHIEAVEFRASEGRERELWSRVSDFGAVHWLVR